MWLPSDGHVPGSERIWLCWEGLAHEHGSFGLTKPCCAYAGQVMPLFLGEGEGKSESGEHHHDMWFGSFLPAYGLTACMWRTGEAESKARVDQESGGGKKTHRRRQSRDGMTMSFFFWFFSSFFFSFFSSCAVVCTVSVCWWRVLAESQVQSQESRREKLHSGGRPPNWPLGGFLPPRAPYRGALIPGRLGMSAPHEALGPVSEAAGAVTETLPVFVLILPICPFALPA